MAGVTVNWWDAHPELMRAGGAFDQWTGGMHHPAKQYLASRIVHLGAHTVLDVGGGNGSLGDALRFGNWSGAYSVMDGAEVCVKRAGEAGHHAFRHDATDVPWPLTARPDVVVLRHVLEHLPKTADVAAVFGEALRHARRAVLVCAFHWTHDLTGGEWILDGLMHRATPLALLRREAAQHGWPVSQEKQVTPQDYVLECWPERLP